MAMAMAMTLRPGTKRTGTNDAYAWTGAQNAGQTYVPRVRTH